MITLLVACESKTKKENRALQEKVTALQQENEAYRNQQIKMTANIQDYKKFLAEINNNLKQIDLSSSMVGELNKEVKKDADLKQAIRTRLSRIVELIKNSKLKIMALDARLNELRKSSNAKGDEILKLESELKTAVRNLMDKELTYLEMTSQLEDLYEEQVAITTELKNILNRAYFYAGTSKELKENGIIEKEGGFIGLGRVKILNANAPDSLFSKIEKSSTDSLVVKSKSIQIISNHPSDSYQIVKTNFQHVIKISDKKAFWNQGNYLIVQKN